MLRNLSAIEIAEGALLADVAVIFHLLTIYLPIGGNFFRVLIFVVFAVLVLRRGLYVGIMGLCVAVFMIAVITGLHGISLLALEGMGSLFLGVTMRYRLPHLSVVLLGVISGALVMYALILFFTLLAGQPLDMLVTELHPVLNQVLALVGVLATKVGLGVWWRQSASPPIVALSTWAFTYWWATFYLLLCLFLSPAVFVIYITTNVFVRLLGYEVRPFPGGKLGRVLQRLRRRVIKLSIKWGILKKLGVRGTT